MTPAPGSLIALTGGTGFLGSHIADTLLARGYQVRVALRPASNRRWLAGKDLQTMVVNLADPQSCDEFLAHSQGLIHCAGVVSARDPRQYQQGNVATTENLLARFQARWRDQPRTGVFILISSLAAHGPAGLTDPAVEDNSPSPISAYGRSKLAAEKAVMRDQWGFRRAILRPPSLYGPRDREFLPLFKAALHWGLTVRLGKAMSGLSLVHGRDAAEAAVALLECDQASGPYFVDDGHRGYDWSELAALLSSLANRRVRTLPVPLGPLKLLSQLLGRRRVGASAILSTDRLRDLSSCGWVCDGSLLQKTTGWAPSRPAAAGFADTLEFFKEQQWL